MPVTFPAHRLAPLIGEYVQGLNTGRDRHDIGGYTALADLAGVSAKTLRRICNGQQPWVSEDTAELIVAALDAPHLWHLPADQGGLADLTELAGAQLVFELGAAA